MARPDLRTRQAKAAQAFLLHKGFGHAVPYDVIAIEDDFCWYFYYDLPDGRLELEVSWESTRTSGEWKYETFFHEDADRMLAASGR